MPLFERSDYFQRLRDQWLPYYSEDLRHRRLAEKRRYFYNNLDHIPLYAERGLVFAAFHRLYLAYLEFLQALFIKKRTYPISYTKWIEEQLLDILGLSSLFPHVKSLLTIDTLGEDQLKKKAQHLRKLGCSFIGTDGPLEKTA
ncbi:MAG: hypothetical protein GWO20_19150 [Candidatus Korarchaeota archaeon]|nr:hypothetical protein [Candidatus Korarchaeota archaeon]NIU85374.1 hypothetical protein [Candidatus Thorarchaeota archaeon]NIW15472.1 hypothetical protein [Candidatus Thorarchaeota archaeon]NIW53416.1 hypothetical protein [Candidatus Korarchaeota archaeon]